MCGILGVINGESSIQGITDVCKFIEQGAVVGQLRGEDSTGMFQVSKRGVVTVHKAPMKGDLFSETKRFKSMANSADSADITVLHHRAATRGSINYENCHPFEHSDQDRYLIGVHNGSLVGTPYKYDGIDFDVDSDYAMYRLFKEREAAFKDLNGPYAFVWYENDGKLRVACNGERSFSFAFIHKKNAILMASEAGMLWWLASRNGIEIDDIVSPESHRMLTFDPSQELRAFTDVKIDKPTVSVVTYPSYTRGATQGNFPHAAGQQRPASSAATQELKPASGGATSTIELDRDFLVGQDVDFYPDRDKSTVSQLVGTVLLEKGSNDSVVVNAILSPASLQIMNNVRSGHIDYLVASVRGVSKGFGGDDVLLLTNISMSCSTNKEEEPMIDGPGLTLITKQEFREMTRNGCSLCSTPISVQSGVDKEIGWNTTTSEPVCATCVAELTGVV